MCVTGKHTSAERKLFLKLCIDNSGLLGKEERMQLECFRKNNVTCLRLLAAVETFEAKLIVRKKEYDIKFLQSNDCQSSVVDCANKDDISLDKDLLEEMED